MSFLVLLTGPRLAAECAADASCTSLQGPDVPSSVHKAAERRSPAASAGSISGWVLGLPETSQAVDMVSTKVLSGCPWPSLRPVPFRQILAAVCTLVGLLSLTASTARLTTACRRSVQSRLLWGLPEQGKSMLVHLCWHTGGHWPACHSTRVCLDICCSTLVAPCNIHRHR